MIVECSNCHAKYNIDESKLPPAGVKVKCHSCQQIIVIRKEEPVAPEVPTPPVEEPTKPQPAQEVPEPAIAQAPSEVEPHPEKAPEPEIPEPPAPPTEQPLSAQVEVPPAAPPAEPSAGEVPEQAPPEPPPQEVPPEPEVPEPEVPAEQAPSESELEIEPRQEALKTDKPAVAEMSEEDKKWNERARRLAKALASDLVLYNQDKVEEGLREGTLAQLLGSEIRRSWEYYCQQIPKHIVEGSDYFKEQLNKIVGKGKEIFK